VTNTLIVLLDGHPAGTLTQGEGGVLELTYDDSYRGLSRAIPVSLSMLLSDATHIGRVVHAFCQGLLPDNVDVLERWARDFQVSARNPFALLRHVGEDCAGAVQFVRPDRVEVMLGNEGSIAPLTDEQIADRLRTLRRDPSAWHLAAAGQFSLAGAQAKTALHRNPDTGVWGDPSGAVPTTHIIKPAIVGFDDHDLNEHLCLSAARIVGLRAAVSSVQSFAGERAIVVDRYDRRPVNSDEVRRVHQEDMCQALGMRPSAKYQSEGGPSPEQIIGLLREVVTPRAAATLEVNRFVDALALNWLIAGTDAHAKNYSMLLTPGQVRLAPLYDIASALPYDDMYLPRLRLAMRIGSEYRIDAITGRHWDAFADRNALDPAGVKARIDDLARRLPDAFRQAAETESVRELKSELPGRLAEKIGEHVERCRLALAR
jgi:serine/threonine-protein kinase HipA